MAQDGPPAAAEPKLQLDPNPTPAEESEEFKNSDDARSAQEHGQHMALLRAKQGHIGSLIGSSQPSLTIALIVIGISGLGFIVCLFGAMANAAVFADLAKLTGTMLLTVAGYVFGVKSSDKDGG